MYSKLGVYRRKLFEPKIRAIRLLQCCALRLRPLKRAKNQRLNQTV
jgi:hypothetical protein